MNDELPAIGPLLPVGAENHWSDLLAVMVGTDPEPMCGLLALDVDPASIRVQRELSIDGKDRIDLVLWSGDRRIAIIEVKVLSGLGRRQLERYRDAMPGADRYAVVHPARLAVDVSHAAEWVTLTWESILAAYSGSGHLWLRSTALAWAEHLDSMLPKVDSSTVWDDVPHGDGFVVAMRARLSWVFGNLTPPAPIQHDFVGSSAGASWVLRMYLDAKVPGYRVMVEVEERLGVRQIPKTIGSTSRRPLGPTVLVALLQREVTTSANFDWDYLAAMVPLMTDARCDWVQTVPNTKGHDRDNYHRMVALGGPKWLGKGFGDAETRINHQCMFGARVNFPPSTTLAELQSEVESLYDLLIAMAEMASPDRPKPDNPSTTRSESRS